MKSTINGIVTTFVGAHYQIVNGTVTKYYFAGASRIAMRTGSTLTYLLGDHLGSTSLTTDDLGNLVSELRYKPWGETRYSSGTTATSYRYTGQREEVSFGLYFYNARWYDPALGRFAQADTIVPRGIQGLDRYAYANNSPVVYIDPTGHFTEKAIREYIEGVCNGHSDCVDDMLADWKADKDWWKMMLAAQAGDVLYGAITIESSTTKGSTTAFGFTFQGEGIDLLSGISPIENAQGAGGITLDDIQHGHGKSVGYDVALKWMGIYRKSNSPKDAFPYTRPGYEPTFIGTPDDETRRMTKEAFIVGGALACGIEGIEGAVVCGIIMANIEDIYYDYLDIEKDDFQVNVGPISFNMQMERGNSGMWNPEHTWWYPVYE